MTMLTYRRHVVQILITLAKPPKVGVQSAIPLPRFRKVFQKGINQIILSKNYPPREFGMTLGDICLRKGKM